MGPLSDDSAVCDACNTAYSASSTLTQALNDLMADRESIKIIQVLILQPFSAELFFPIPLFLALSAATLQSTVICHNRLTGPISNASLSALKYLYNRGAGAHRQGCH